MTFPKYIVALTICGFACCTSSLSLAQSPSSGVNQPPKNVAIEFLHFKHARIKNKINQSDNRLRELVAERQAIQKNLSENRISEASFAEVMRLLHSQRVQLMIDLAGLEARNELLAVQLERQKPESEPAATAKLNELLEAYVANQRQALERLQELAKRNSVSSAELLQGKQLLMQAEIRLAESKQKQAAMRQPTTSINRLGDTELELAEKKARLAQVESLLTSYVDVRRMVENAARLERDALAEETLKVKLSAQLVQLESDIEELSLKQSQAGDQD